VMVKEREREREGMEECDDANWLIEIPLGEKQ